MKAGMICLERGTTRLRMMDPLAAEPYYRGTRFDRTGVILSLESGGHRYVQPWQRHYDPLSHDAVSGPAEEFLPVLMPALEPASGARSAFGVTQPQRSEDGRSRMRTLSAGILKIGVGLLRDDGEPYDRFKLYEILDPGRTTVTLGQAAETGETGPAFGVTQPQRSEDGRSRNRSLPADPTPSAASFQQNLNGCYDYRKTVEIPAEGQLRITHTLTNRSALPFDTYVYCHNFFILDGAPTGRATRFTFPFRPTGDWRAPYDSVRLTDRGIAFDRDLAPAETVFMGNLRPTIPGREREYCFTLQNLDNGLRVEAACDRAMDYAVFWSNPEVSCLEPYIPLRLAPGQTACWTLSYRFC